MSCRILSNDALAELTNDILTIYENKLGYSYLCNLDLEGLLNESATCYNYLFRALKQMNFDAYNIYYPNSQLDLSILDEPIPARPASNIVVLQKIPYDRYAVPQSYYQFLKNIAYYLDQCDYEEIGKRPLFKCLKSFRNDLMHFIVSNHSAWFHFEDEVNEKSIATLAVLIAQQINSGEALTGFRINLHAEKSLIKAAHEFYDLKEHKYVDVDSLYTALTYMHNPPEHSCHDNKKLLRRPKDMTNPLYRFRQLKYNKFHFEVPDEFWILLRLMLLYLEECMIEGSYNNYILLFDAVKDFYLSFRIFIVKNEEEFQRCKLPAVRATMYETLSKTELINSHYKYHDCEPLWKPITLHEVHNLINNAYTAAITSTDPNNWCYPDSAFLKLASGKIIELPDILIRERNLQKKCPDCGQAIPSTTGSDSGPGNNDTKFCSECTLKKELQDYNF